MEEKTMGFAKGLICGTILGVAGTIAAVLLIDNADGKCTAISDDLGSAEVEVDTETEIDSEE